MSDSDNESEMEATKSALYDDQTPDSVRTAARRRSKRVDDQKSKKQKSSSDLSAKSNRSKSAIQSLSQPGQVHTYKDLKKIFADCFEFEVRGADIKFIEELYTSIPSLYEIWERIGFNKETVDKRLDNFYDNLKVTHS